MTRKHAGDSPYGTIALVTGASSGIGLATIQALADQGFTVYAASRSIQKALATLPLSASQRERIMPLPLDCLDARACDQAIARIVAEQGSLSILVHCAGAGIAGSVEETTSAEVAWQMDNLFLGTVQITRPALTAMRQHGRGLVVLLGSVAGQLPIPFHTFYSAGKAAVHAFGLALADEVRPLGIQVSVISPGDTRTGFTRARVWSAANLPGTDSAKVSPYRARLERSVATMAHDEQHGHEPAVVVRAICRQIYRRRPALLYTVGRIYQIETLLARWVPIRLVRLVVRMLYHV